MSRYHKVFSKARDPHVVAYLDRDNEIQFAPLSSRDRAEAWIECAFDNDWTMVSIHRGGVADVPRAVVDEMRVEIRARAVREVSA